jgi:hypothetical protein
LRVFATKSFRRFQRRERIEERALREAIDRAEGGTVDANLGAGLIKQRVARKGAGRSGGYRTIIAYRAERRAVFRYGFAKGGRANIGAADLRDLADYGVILLRLDEAEIGLLIAENELEEISP